MSLDTGENKRHYVLTGLMASFPVPVTPDETEFNHSVSSSDVDIADYFSASRTYSDITLRPVLVPIGNRTSMVPDIELLGKGVVARLNHALYHVENHSDRIDRFLICDALHAALSLLGHPLEKDLVLLPIDPSDISANRLSAEDLYRKSNQGTDAPLYVYDEYLDTRYSLGYEFDDLMWIVATILVEYDVLLYASLFIRESMMSYQFLGDDIREVLLTYEKLPDTISEGVKIENAIHNCYKAIEAIHGGNLPQNTNKILRNFRELGIDLSKLTGYSLNEVKQEPAIDKLIRLRSRRDYKSAHGRIGPNRKSTYYELMDFQELARYIVRGSVYHYTDVNVLYSVSG